jgi:enhancing lycopene biosynthesis protein 2
MAHKTAKLEEISSSSAMSLLYKPFQTETPKILPELDAMDSGEMIDQNIEEVEAIPEEKLNVSSESPLEDSIIEERNGINYITNFKIDANIKNFDSGFKDLVDSVLKQKD